MKTQIIEKKTKSNVIQFEIPLSNSMLDMEEKIQDALRKFRLESEHGELPKLDTDIERPVQ